MNWSVALCEGPLNINSMPSPLLPFFPPATGFDTEPVAVPYDDDPDVYLHLSAYTHAMSHAADLTAWVEFECDRAGPTGARCVVFGFGCFVCLFVLFLVEFWVTPACHRPSQWRFLSRVVPPPPR